MLTFADGAVLLAGAALFRHVAHRAKDGTGHGSLQGKLYLTMARRGKKRLVRMMRVIYSAARNFPDAIFSYKVRFFDASGGAC